MAISMVVFSSILAGETASLSKSSSLSSLRFVVPSVPSSQVNLRAVTTASSKAAAAETGKREPRGITKPRRVSPEMGAFLGGVSEIPRTQALKLIWAYIKQHDLQDPQNKKMIVCDEKLKNIFGGRERVGFLEVAGLINPHFLK
ncbi:Upstream activation factor subunit spp27 like [Actinidia chinensis var. chinensis]|uniref:Upstream activation factor subunit spp27 like n=1 Tax=Actinidia chinensis var. chinensis TaxID=1590841 RepID=A0A2R6RGY7_ACTCC|nr:Upstream activation factor subunit spp27 like [Actinidia chinensis var. chinensis]